MHPPKLYRTAVSRHLYNLNSIEFDILSNPNKAALALSSSQIHLRHSEYLSPKGIHKNSDSMR